eukprot:6413038-Ditylum_brightwellii.AAC.1
MAKDPPFITITPFIWQVLQDWGTIIKQLKHIPTQVHQVVPNTPKYVTYMDACKLGTGGVWCPGTDDMNYMVWKVEFPLNIQSLLQTDNNPS